MRVYEVGDGTWMYGWMHRRIGGYRDQPVTTPMGTGMVDGWKN